MNTSTYFYLPIEIPCFSDFKGIFVCIACFLLSFSLFSQGINLGTPLIINYSKEDYLGGTQSWDAIYSKNGHVFFANNDGLISFDGNNWERYFLPNRTVMRSLVLAGDKIYVGGQDEIGYYFPDKFGNLKYVSIKDKLPEGYQKLEDIWEMEFLEGALYFRSNDRIFKYLEKEDTTLVFGNGNPITFLSKYKDGIFFNDQLKGIYRIQNNSASFIEESAFLKDISIIEILSLQGDDYLILTERNGIYAASSGIISKWETNAQDFLKENRITSGVKMNNGNMAVGTQLGGMVIFNPEGQAIYKLSRENGLQNNSISTMCEDKSGNLWIGSYNGIDLIKFSKPLSIFYPDGVLEGTLYDIEVWKNKIFFGTNNGLYYIEQKNYYDPFVSRKIELVTYSSGQVWGLDIVDDQLFMAHNDGAFTIGEDMTATRISKEPGAWKFLQVTTDKMIVGTYRGLDLYQKNGGKWQWKKAFDGFSESSRIMIFDQEKNLWVTHPYRGVFRIKYNEINENISVEQYGPDKGVMTNQGNYIFNIDGNAIITNLNGISSYDYNLKKFKPDSSLLTTINERETIKRLVPSSGGMWYISDKGAGEILKKEEGITQKLIAENHEEIGNIFVGGFENLYPYDETNTFLCTTKGAIIYTKKETENRDLIKAKINKIHLISPKDSLLFGGFGDTSQSPELSNKENALRFSFTSDRFENQKDVTYSYQLAGLDDKWSEWSSTTSKEYTNLNSGEYQFLLKAKSINGKESNPISFAFTIRPAWYESFWAIGIYVALIGLVLISLVVVPRKKHKKETALLKSEQEKTAAEVKKLKQENLENQIRFKNQELASATMHLLQKNETLSLLREKMLEVQKRVSDEQIRKEIKNLITLFEDDIRLEDDWKNFSHHFDQVHHDFTKRIKTDFPDLTPKDQKLCAYLRMNLSTKEIAPLLNISVRGVEIHRYRLRKKIGLEKEVNLNEFMMGF